MDEDKELLNKELLKGNTPTLILAVLETASRHGYGIAREIERRSDNALAFKEGTLYPALHALEREGLIVGAMVTLRGKQMEAFVDRLISYVLPRIRDFRGLPTNLDGHGNYAIGLTDHSIFPEIPSTDLTRIFGMQIQVTTTAGNDVAGKALLKQIGFPFRPDRKSAEASAA